MPMAVGIGDRPETHNGIDFKVGKDIAVYVRTFRNNAEISDVPSVFNSSYVLAEMGISERSDRRMVLPTLYLRHFSELP